jgi:hypothetical protein
VPIFLSDLVGTLRSAFKINRANIDASGLTAARSFALPDQGGTLALTSQLSGGLGGVAIITLPDAAGVFEWEQQVATPGVITTHRIMLTLAAVPDTAENDPAFLALQSLSGQAASDAIIISAVFSELTSGPISINWSAQ